MNREVKVQRSSSHLHSSVLLTQDIFFKILAPIIPIICLFCWNSPDVNSAF